MSLYMIAVQYHDNGSAAILICTTSYFFLSECHDPDILTRITSESPWHHQCCYHDIIHSV